MNSSLFSAKRVLERAVDAVKDAVRPNYKAINRESPLDYFFATAANKAAFMKRVAAIQRADYMPEAAANLVIHAVTEYQRVEEMVAAEKARLTSKRATIQSNNDLKTSLNLQEGVSLKGVDVGQYKVILAGLEPVRLHVYAVQKKSLEDDRINVARELMEQDFKVAQYPTYPANAPRDVMRELNLKHDADRKRFTKWFTISFDGKARLRGDNAERIEKSAQQFALAYVQGYAAKLALKTGEVLANDPALKGGEYVVTHATVSSNNLWADSIARIGLVPSANFFPNAILRFHTQIIWNRSCLGKVFNQYPTRRVV